MSLNSYLYRLLFLTLLVIVGMVFTAGCEPVEEPVEEPEVIEVVERSVDAQGRPEPDSEAAKRIRSIVDSEEVNQSLAPLLAHMANLMMSQEIGKIDFVSKEFQYEGLEAYTLPVNETTSVNDIFRQIKWPLSSQFETATAGQIWKPVFDLFDVKGLKFGILGGAFGDSNSEFIMHASCEAHAESKSGNKENSRFGISGKQQIRWVNVEGSWEIAAWKQESFNLIGVDGLLFENVTEVAIPDADTVARITQSQHEELIISRLQSGSMESPRPEDPYFADWESSNQYPSATVVDIDSDGLEDLFLVDRWDKTLLMKNQGDGTYRDITKQSGLEIEGFSNCALFFDYDNDGDKDAFVGRNRKSSLFFKNQEGVFVPDVKMNELMSDTLCVVSGSVADINRDGLLDLYLCTYGYGAGDPQRWVDATVRDLDRAEMKGRFGEQSHYLDRVGPPNLVLINTGGEFRRVEINNDLKQWRNTYQSVWADFDGDQDLDLYLTNDFSPDAFLRNDTERESLEPRFTDVTNTIVTDGSIGFGMGASWGDYNHDGCLDLYVSNMYSKAGMRIVGQLEEVDPRIAVSARGNFLYEGDGKGFQQVAGMGPEKVHVSKVGWSFGGQWADFDNDGLLDLYVPSGYYSAPKTVATTTDL
ncbi:MAG: VCBS repeat-containing protein [Mariniblastus sp.]|nr:VCBS repeat-containing protein [Mariniblastus sp.]